MNQSSISEFNEVSEAKEPQPTFRNTCIVSYEIFPPSADNIHERKFNVSSSSGNKYTVTVNQTVKCTCPHYCYRLSNTFERCKHINFIMDNILHEPFKRCFYSDKVLDHLFKYLPGNIPHLHD